MSRLSVSVPQAMLCVLALAGTSCRVYDSELLELGAGGRSDNQLNASTVDSVIDAGAGAFVVPACGNGRKDERERCDIAIPQGEPDACPDGCDARDGCLAEVLMGQRCGARCAPKEITESLPGDGCCPNGATPATDSDCSATCGNGMIEADETCDPAESCPRPESCKTSKACTVARLTGAAGTCSARCQELPLESCESGDGCCPQGCAEQGDRDCPTNTVTPPPSTSAEAGTSSPDSVCKNGEQCTGEQLSAECSAVHSGGRCHSCDCAYCAAEVATCESATKDTGACSRVVECALQNHCQGADCLCGDNLANCQNRPLGPCLWEIRELAGSRDYYSIWWTASMPGTPLAVALSVLQCRTDHCAETCGL